MTTPIIASAAAQAYVAETVALLGDRDPIEILAETPSWLLERLGSLDIEVLRAPEGPGQWSLTQVLAHLADTEIAMGWRARLLLTQDAAPLHGFDEAAWMVRFDGANTDPMEAMLAFGTLLGPLGVLLATPMLLVLTVFVVRLYVQDTLGKGVKAESMP